jgi:ubiquinone/menaquinone biosynthesis C-methylase UbiE
VFLDWGCHYGPDSCLLRSVYGERIELHACDFAAETEFACFREFARPLYAQLKNVVQLPYPDGTFDAVIGSGVLEHTAMDYESLKEVYRILKPAGVLVITFLPYFLSWSEWYRRSRKMRPFHWRLYGRREFSQLLKRTGFRPVEIGFQTFVPNLFGEGILRW